MRNLNVLIRNNFIWAISIVAILSCTKTNNSAFKAEGIQATKIVSCGAINMTPPVALTPQSNIVFESILPPDEITNFQWNFKKQNQNILTTSSNPVSHTFNGALEGSGSYVAQSTFLRSDGNTCSLVRAFQILTDDNVCAKPTGISGQDIGYTNEELSFFVNSEDCFEGSLHWDMDGDGVVEYNTHPFESIKHTYQQPGIYTIKVQVIDNGDDNQMAPLTFQIEIRNRSCLNPFTNTPVLDGQSVEYAKANTECGSKSCLVENRICTDGTFGGDTTYTENPLDCKPSAACPIADCTFNGQTVAHGSSITAYLEQNTTCPATCESESRTCNNGVLSGTYTSSTCKASTCSYSWDVSAWGACSATLCGTNGTQNRTVVCKREDGVIVSDSNCTSPKPAVTQSCSTPACPHTYSWRVGDYGACSAVQCGTSGVQTRPVACLRDDGVVVADANCSTPKPEITKVCSARPCNACPLPWGGSVSHGGSISAYQAAIVSCGSNCVSQKRVCNDGNLSGTYTQPTCSVGICTSLMKGSTCHAYMGTVITWKDDHTGQKCIGNLFGNLMVGDYLQIGGTHYTSGNNPIKPWDEATHRGHAKIVCSTIPDEHGMLPFKVESGTCKPRPHEPNLIKTPMLSSTTPSDCSASPVPQQAFGSGTCAVYRQGSLGDMPIKGVFLQTGAKKYVTMGEYMSSTEHLNSSTQGRIFSSSIMKITYNGETKELSSYCGDSTVAAPNNSTCSKISSVKIGGVTFTMGVGAKNTIDPVGYIPEYIGSFKNTAKTKVWSQKTCGVVTMSTSLGYLPPPCP